MKEWSLHWKRNTNMLHKKKFKKMKRRKNSILASFMEEKLKLIEKMKNWWTLVTTTRKINSLIWEIIHSWATEKWFKKLKKRKFVNLGPLHRKVISLSADTNNQYKSQIFTTNYLFRIISYIVFPNIVGNYSFLNLEIQRSQYIRPKATVHKCAETI